MRRFNKFKLYSNSNVSFKKISKNLNTFYRPKWNFAKKKLSRVTKSQFQFVDLLINKVSFKTIQRVKQHYKLKYQKKRILESLFTWGFHFKKKKFLTNKKDILASYLVQPLFKIDILLWYLNFFQSLYKVRQYINSSCILVNNKSISSNYILKCGDVITLNYDKFDWNRFSFDMYCNKYIKDMTFFSFVEIDQYTKTIVIVKDFNSLILEDFKLLVHEHFTI